MYLYRIDGKKDFDVKYAINVKRWPTRNKDDIDRWIWRSLSSLSILFSSVGFKESNRYYFLLSEQQG